MARYSSRRTWFIWLGGALVGLLVVVALYNWTVLPYQSFLGTWNYDQPDLTSDTNNAHLQGGVGYVRGIPQIGTVTFSRTFTGEILGHTDQGCTWRFNLDGDSLHLASTNQYCYNRVVNLGYNIYQWDETLDHGKLREVLKAHSYLPNGTFDFILLHGQRSRAGDSTTSEASSQFNGAWYYQPADLASQFNIVTKVHISAEKPPHVTQGPMTGTVQLTAHGTMLTALTDDGCRWQLEVHGNTAELATAPQICHTAHGARSLSFWAIASDGQEQYSMLAGTDEQGDISQLVIGHLRKL